MIIANDEYIQVGNRLKKSIANARALENTLENMNFSRVFKHENEALEKDIMKHVKDFTEEFENGDIVFFYYSGHAQQVNGVNYLIPTNDVEINSEDDIELFGANVQRIVDRLTENKPRSVFIIVLDGCRKLLLTCM